MPQTGAFFSQAIGGIFLKLFLMTALVMLAFAANSVLNRAALVGGDIGPLPFALIRVLAGAVILAALASATSGTAWLRRMTLGGVVSLALYLVGFSAAYLSLDAGAGALILFAGVQVTMFGGALWAGEDVPLRRWVGSGLALAGLAWMLWPGEGAISLLHGGFMAAAAFGWGLYSLIGRASTEPLATTAAAFLGAVPLVALALFFWLGAGNISGWGIFLAVLSGSVTSGLGYALWYAVLPQLGATRAAVAQLTVPVIAVCGGVLLLSEAVSLRLLLSCILVIGGVSVGLMSRSGSKTAPSPR